MDEIFVGRKEEIKRIMSDLREKRIVMVYGEQGMGKSMFLEKLNLMLKDDGRVFVGFLDQGKAFLFGGGPLLDPFIEVLSDIISDIYEREGRIGRLKNLAEALSEVIPEMAKDIPAHVLKAIGKSILEKIFGKWGVEEFEDLSRRVEDASPKKFINENENTARTQYTTILTKLAKRYSDKRFVLIFDQLEKFSESEATANFLLGTLRATPKKCLCPSSI